MNDLPESLSGILKEVSRSIYLSLRVLPKGVRAPMGLGYLFCRAADSIADLKLISRLDRRRFLDQFAELFVGKADARPALAEIQGALSSVESPRERRLLERLEECFRVFDRCPKEEKVLLREVVLGVVNGMKIDLEVFPGEDEGELRSFATRKELEDYCHWIGGMPGIFWTKLSLLRLSGLKSVDAPKWIEQGEQIGCGLQITNILRDLPDDLRIGRCYLPEEDLKKVSLRPEDLLDPKSFRSLRPVYLEWIRWGVDRLASGERYLKSLPASSLRMRLAVAWPLFLAWETLERLSATQDVLRPDVRIKVPRRRVYALLFSTPFHVWRNGWVEGACARRSGAFRGGADRVLQT